MKFLIEHACAGLFLKPGRGKTSVALGALEFLRKRGMLKRTLVVAPVRVCHSVWPREIAKWSEFSHLRTVLLHGPDKDARLQEDADIYLINYEGLEWLLDAKRIGKRTMQVDLTKLEDLKIDLIIFDELSKMKNGTSNRFQAMAQALHLFGRRWGLTGSPASNGLIDLWGQCYTLDMGRSLSPYITNFRNTYFYVDRSGYNYTLIPGMEDAIYKRIAPLVLQQDDDKSDMPSLSDNVIMIDLPERVMETYRRLEKDLLVAVNENIITAATAATASMKVRQIAAGGIYLDLEPGKGPNQPRRWENLHYSKIEALADLVDELQGQPLLVGYEFEHDLDRLKWQFPKACYVADLTPAQFDKVVDQWNRGEIPLLIGHPASMGHGLNLQGAGRDVCFLSPGWNFELFDQFIRRVWRPGNTHKKVTVHHLIAAGTIEERIFAVLRSKDSTQNALFAALKQLAREKRNAR